MRRLAIVLFGLTVVAAADIGPAAAQSCAAGLYWDGRSCQRMPTRGYNEPGYPTPRQSNTGGGGYYAPGYPTPRATICPPGTYYVNGGCRR